MRIMYTYLVNSYCIIILLCKYNTVYSIYSGLNYI